MQPPKPYREERPWGEFIEFTRNTPSSVKIISVRAHEALSLQNHQNRDEFWHILSGDGRVTIGDDTLSAEVGRDYFIPRAVNHRLEAGAEQFVVLEISFGIFEDNDIVRVADKYGRSS